MPDNPLSSAPLPPKERPFVRILSPGVGTDVRLLSYSGRVVGVYTHWWQDRTHPHLPGAGLCPACCERVPIRWKGYLYGWSPDWSSLGLLEIPADTVRCSLPLRDPSVNLVGAHITLRRIGPHRNSAVVATVRLDASTVQGDADEDTVLSALWRVWGVGAGPLPAARPDNP